MTTDYSTVTEMPGNQITQHAFQMIRSRYSVAREHCEDKEVLEVERLLVKVLLEDRDNIEPLDGISPSEQIVVAGQAGLKDGAAVRLVGAEG